MVQVHPVCSSSVLICFAFFCPKIPRHYFLSVHVVSPLRALGTANPFSVSDMIGVSKIICSIELSTSVSGIILVSTKQHINSKFGGSSSSVLFDSYALTVSFHHIFALQIFVHTDEKARERNRLKFEFHCVQFCDAIVF